MSRISGRLWRTAAKGVAGEGRNNAALITAKPARVLLVTRRARAVVTPGGLLASSVACALFGAAPGGMVALATLCFAAFGPSIIGSSSVPSGEIDPREVRRFRQDRPGPTISEAAAAVTRP
jgi:hypothetical protein